MRRIIRFGRNSRRLSNDQTHTVDQVTWTPDMLREFKRTYSKAVKDKVLVFTYRGHQFIPDYAKYLIEYLESQFDEER